LKDKPEIKSPKTHFLNNTKSGFISEYLFKGETIIDPTRKGKKKNSNIQVRDCYRTLAAISCPVWCDVFLKFRCWNPICLCGGMRR
jgi:hypothetical protein